MNIMLVSVTERQKRSASESNWGAPTGLLNQFLIEP